MKIKVKANKYMIAVVTVWGISIGLLFVGYFALMQPQSLKLQQLRIQYQDSQQQSDHAQMAAMTESLNRLLDKREQSKNLIETFSIRQDDVTGLVFEIGQIANELALSDFSSKTQNQASYSTLGKSKILNENWLNVEFEGTFEQYVRYMNKLERNQPVVFIEEVFFRRGNDSKAHKATLDLSFLTQTEKVNGSLAVATAP